MALSARLIGPSLEHFREFQFASEQRLERAALIATNRATKAAHTAIRGSFRQSGIGRLGKAIGWTSDLEKGKGVFRRGGQWSASGFIYVKTTNERTVGTIESYTAGSEIRPIRGRYLWIPTDDIKRVAGSGANRRRLEPSNWKRFGMDTKVGPLIEIKSINGYPLLIVKNASVNAAGKSRSARALTKKGRLVKGQVAKTFIVAFIGIPHTSRRSRVNINQIVSAEKNRLNLYINDALGRN